MIRILAAGFLLCSCAASVQQTVRTEMPNLPPVTAAPGPIAYATETAVRESSTTLTPRFPYPIMHRDFDPHGDCTQWDAWLLEYGMTPLDKAYRIMARESGCLPGVWNILATGPDDHSYGLFQINMIGNLGPDRQRLCGLSDPELVDGMLVYLDLFDAKTNIRCAGELKKIAGWQPWGG